MPTMPAGSVLSEDGCRSAGEVAPGVTLVKNVRVPVRDGTRLAADVYFPSAALASGEAVSLVMEYIPYRKDEVAPGHRFYEYLPQQGYAVARVDIRGSGASPGTTRDEYLMQEQLDGVDSVEWFAGRPWCTGHVNMMGISYGGFTSLQIASHAPPHLTSIIPMYFTDDRYTDDCHFRGGLMRKYYDVTSYGNMMVAWNALPPYPDWSDDWAEVWQEHLDGNEPYLLEWFRHQVDSDYWANGSVGRAVEQRPLPGVPDRRLAGRLSESAAAPVLAAAMPEEGAGRDRGITGRRTLRCPGRASTICTRSCAGSTTGAAAPRTA